MSVTWKDLVTEVAGTRIAPLACRFRQERARAAGTLDQLPYYDSLAEEFDVLAPHLPGWGNRNAPNGCAIPMCDP